MHAGDTDTGLEWKTNRALHFAVSAASEMGFVASDLCRCSSKEVVARWQCCCGNGWTVMKRFNAMEMKSLRV